MTAGALGLVALGGLAFAVLKMLGMHHAAAPLIALAVIIALPLTFIFVAISGTMQSSIWTIGYLTQEQK
jgi:hypothetical protein